jgi:hypothetical protein
VWTFIYNTPTTGHFQDERGYARPRTNSGATYVEFVWSGTGLQKKLSFLDRNRKPRPDTWGAFGVRMDHDARGLVISETYLGPQGQPLMLPGGYAEYRYKYDDLGNIVEGLAFDANGRHVSNRNGVAGYRRTVDANGNIPTVDYIGVDGQPAMNWRGAARWTYVFNEHGNATEIRHFGVNGERLSPRGAFLQRIEHDSSGNVTARAIFDADEKPTNGLGGYQRITYAPSQSAFSRVEATFDAAGRPAKLLSNNPHKLKITGDVHGLVTERAYFDENDRPALDRHGVHSYQNKYDDRGDQTEVRHLGSTGELVVHARDRAARITRSHDEYGNVLEESFFGTDGRPCPGRDGAARTTFKYDDYGNRTELAHFGIDGKPTRGAVGYARAEWKYDLATNLHTGSAYFDETGKPVRTQVVVREVRSPSLARPVPVPWKQGDVLLTYEGNEVRCAVLFLNLKARESSAEPPRKLVVLRDGQPVTLDFPAGAIRSESDLETRATEAESRK